MQAEQQSERERFEAWYNALPYNGYRAGLTLLDAWNARAALSRPSTPQGWQDIESAPKDGTPMLVFHNRMVIEAWYSSSWHRFVQSETGGHNGIYPQHWMPLPHPPEQGSKG